MDQIVEDPNKHEVNGYAKITLEFLVPLYTDSTVSVPSIKEGLLDDATRWDTALMLVENEQFKVEVELFAGSKEDAAVWVKEATDSHGERDGDLDDEDDDDSDDDDEDDEDDEDA